MNIPIETSTSFKDKINFLKIWLKTLDKNIQSE